jgi:FMN phosphatase YigB (HAD superfamily)
LKTYKVVLFDAANTLIHKPDLWDRLSGVLRKYDIFVDDEQLRKKHKLVSEIIHFPDRTSAEFYRRFNYEYLLSLGIIADNQMLDDIFSACTYLPWKAFDDTAELRNIQPKKAILSNFNFNLSNHIEEIFGENFFDVIIGSEKEGLSKPDLGFYNRALEILDVAPQDILYIGDSLKLDVIPAQSLGIDAWLMDRDNNFGACKKRVTSFGEFAKLLSHS